MLRQRSFVCIYALVGALILPTAAARQAAGETLRVMTFNIWVGGESGGQPLDQTVRVILAAQADVVAMQETHGEERDGRKPDAARAIAEKLAWHHFDQGNEDTGIVSRYRIVGYSPQKWGVEVELPSGRRVWLFNVHFAHWPYQPYQLLKIPYSDAPFIDGEEAAVAEAHRARGDQVAALLEEVVAVRNDDQPVFIAGDFNEPSALDWTEEVARAGKCPVAVRWPATAALAKGGFVDAYRRVHPAPLISPGYTWTPVTAEDDPRDRHDRIDFVFVTGTNVRIDRAEVVGERPERADIVVTPFPSDHRAVVVTVTLQ